MAGLRAEPLVNSLVNLAGLQGKEAIRFAATGLEAVNKNDAPGVFHWLSTIAEHKSNEISSYDKAGFFTKAFGRLQEWGASFDTDKPSSTNIADILKMPAVKSYQKAYVEAANKALSDLKAIAALYTGTTAPTAQSLKSVLEKLEPKVRTEAMQNLLTEIAKPASDQNTGSIDSWITQIQTKVNNPVAHIQTTFNQLSDIATTPADVNGTFANDDAKSFNNISHIGELQALASDATLMGAKPSKELVGLFQEFKLEAYSSSTSPTEKPTHTADKSALEAALKAEAKMFNKKDTELPALIDSSGSIDWKAVQEFKKGFAEHTPEGGSKTTVDAQVAKLLEILKEHGTGLSDLTPENLDAKITEMLKKSDNPENKGFWFGGGVVNWGITLIAAVLAALGFKSADDSKKELKKAAQERMTQEAQIADVLRQVMATEQQDIASVKKSVNEVRYAIVRMKDVSTKRVAIKQKSKGKTRNNAPEGHEQANTTRMNAKSGQTKVRMNAEGDEEGGLPTDSMNDTTGDNTGSIENDLPPVDDGMNQDMNPAEENQIDGNDQEEIQSKDEQQPMNNQDDRQDQGNYDQDGRSPEANSTIDGQPNSTRPMEGEGNNIVPKSKRVYISRGDGQPINVTKHAPAAVTTINFESDRYGNIPKKVTNKGGGDFDNE